jgi:hypothetical protein
MNKQFDILLDLVLILTPETILIQRKLQIGYEDEKFLKKCEV